MGPTVPNDRPTRGRTRPGRLARLDPFLAGIVAGWPADGPDTILDVGLGARPDTTVELHRALVAVRPGVHTVGLDLRPEPVAALEALGEPGLSGVVGGFDTPVGGRIGLVRAANLLRQYALPQVPSALAALGRWLEPGGILVEGSTDRDGHRGAFRVFRAAPGGLHPLGLLFLCELSGPFHPRALTPYLPRGLGWHGHPAPVLRPLFHAWTTAFERSHPVPPEQRFARCASELGARHPGIGPSAEGWAAGRLFVGAVSGGLLTPQPDLIHPYPLDP